MSILRYFHGEYEFDFDFVKSNGTGQRAHLRFRAVTPDEIKGMGFPPHIEEQFPLGALEITWRGTAKGKPQGFLLVPTALSRDTAKTLLGLCWDLIRNFRYLV